MIRTLRPSVPLLAFGLGLATVYVAAFVIVSRLSRLENADLVAVGLTLDLTVVVPLLYYLLLVRRRGWPLVSLLPVFIASVLLAGKLLPASQHGLLDLMKYGVAAAEAAVVGFLIYKTVQVRREFRRRAVAGHDVYATLRESARSLLGSGAGTLVAYEVAVFYYAFCSWRERVEQDPSAFGYHRRIGYMAVVTAVMLAALVELVAVHLLVGLWSATAAWILTGLSFYALVWLVGDTQAIRLRPIVVTAETLHVRLGLRWTIEIPREAIERVEVREGVEPPREKAAYLKAVLLGAPNCRIELKRAVEALGLYGIRRQVTTLDLQLDEPERFGLSCTLRTGETPRVRCHPSRRRHQDLRGQSRGS